MAYYLNTVFKTQIKAKQRSKTISTFRRFFPRYTVKPSGTSNTYECYGRLIIYYKGKLIDENNMRVAIDHNLKPTTWYARKKLYRLLGVDMDELRDKDLGGVKSMWIAPNGVVQHTNLTTPILASYLNTFYTEYPYTEQFMEDKKLFYESFFNPYTGNDANTFSYNKSIASLDRAYNEAIVTFSVSRAYSPLLYTIDEAVNVAKTDLEIGNDYFTKAKYIYDDAFITRNTLYIPDDMTDKIEVAFAVAVATKPDYRNNLDNINMISDKFTTRFDYLSSIIVTRTFRFIIISMPSNSSVYTESVAAMNDMHIKYLEDLNNNDLFYEGIVDIDKVNKVRLIDSDMGRMLLDTYNRIPQNINYNRDFIFGNVVGTNTWDTFMKVDQGVGVGVKEKTLKLIETCKLSYQRERLGFFEGLITFTLVSIVFFVSPSLMPLIGFGGTIGVTALLYTGLALIASNNGLYGAAWMLNSASTTASRVGGMIFGFSSTIGALLNVASLTGKNKISSTISLAYSFINFRINDLVSSIVKVGNNTLGLLTAIEEANTPKPAQYSDEDQEILDKLKEDEYNKALYASLDPNFVETNFYINSIYWYYDPVDRSTEYAEVSGANQIDNLIKVGL